MPILVTGGARSGKSSFAEELSMSLSSTGIYIATAQVYDDEMSERVRLHRTQREQSNYAWETREEPYELTSLLSSYEGKGRVVLVDCLTLWLSNVLLQVESEDDAAAKIAVRIDALAETVRTYAGPLVLVTNEVGNGIVPEYPLGRLYRDLAGIMNRKLAGVCGQVFLVTAGIPIELKSRAYRI